MTRQETHPVTDLALPACSMLGIEVTGVTYDSLHEYILRSIGQGEKRDILHVNINAMNLTADDEEFRRILNSADLVFADGMGIVYASRLLGSSVPQRITYADWLWAFAEFSAQNRISWFLLGGIPGVAEGAAKSLLRRHPRLDIVGTHHGFFRKSGSQNTAVLEAINRVHPDVLLVCFGMPLQEKWIARYRDSAEAKIFLAGGACLDYVSGTKARCPKWMGDLGLEWLFRLFQEPRRLGRRYLIGNPAFLMRLLSQLLNR